MNADYLIIGAGAQGLIFADEILTHSQADIILIDRRHRVGGHWNDAYPFVTLHQPSAFYGLGSRPLGSDRIETRGPNAGLYEQASGLEVLDHFDRAMKDRFLSSGRVRFLGMHEYVGDWQSQHRVRALVTGEDTAITVRRRLVDTTSFRVSTPETHVPSFKVDADAPFTTPRRLPGELPGHSHVVILGGGKTSMDVAIWLIETGFPAERISWVRPRDSWLINREAAQPGDAGMLRIAESQANKVEASAAATSLDDLFDRLEASEELLRIDPQTRPGMFHGATISRGEVKLMRQVSDVIGEGHVSHVARGRLDFHATSRRFPEDTLFIDCTARAFRHQPARPVFEPGKITLQIVREGLVCLSAAAIGHVEASYDDDAEKNRLCPPVPYEEHPIVWARGFRAELAVQAIWAQDKPLRRWARGHRLTGFGAPSGEAAQSRMAELAEVIAAQREQAMTNLDRLIAAHGPPVYA
jgi:hypothetical protein